MFKGLKDSEAGWGEWSVRLEAQASHLHYVKDNRKPLVVMS